MNKTASTVVVCAVYLLLSLAGVTFIKSGHNTESILEIPGIGLSLSLRTVIGIIFYGLSFLVFGFQTQYWDRYSRGIRSVLLCSHRNRIFCI